MLTLFPITLVAYRRSLKDRSNIFESIWANSVLISTDSDRFNIEVVLNHGLGICIWSLVASAGSTDGDGTSTSEDRAYGGTDESSRCMDGIRETLEGPKVLLYELIHVSPPPLRSILF